MTRFRPCIDLHEGKVKQIVGGTYSEDGVGLETNFVSEQPPSHFAERYRADELQGGHVVMLGPGNEAAAREALAAYPGGLQIGGGISAANAVSFLDGGASHVIVTSSLFDADGKFLEEALRELSGLVGRERLVLDLSCRAAGESWVVAMNRWQTLTDLEVNVETLGRLYEFCSEFLIHAADIEGQCGGIDERLVAFLGQWGEAPVTYAGGARSVEDLGRVDALSGGCVDLTIGSALDIFGGTLVRYADCVAWNRGERGEQGDEQ